MGYTTDFHGGFEVHPPLEPHHAEYLTKFAETRRVKRDSALTTGRYDPYRRAVDLPIGTEGEYYVAASGFRGQGHETGIVDYNNPPSTQPGLWCQWIPSDDGMHIVWDGGEKFYNYVEWLQYIIDNFLVPWCYTLHGQVNWQGENASDTGSIVVVDNQIMTKGR